MLRLLEDQYWAQILTFVYFPADAFEVDYVGVPSDDRTSK
jgi:hypothetical protein